MKHSTDSGGGEKPKPFDRKGYYVRPGKRPMVPAVAFGVCCSEDVSEIATEPGALSRVWGSCSAWTARRVGGKWRHPHGETFTDPPDLFRWMASHARPDARNYVVAPVASDVLTLSGFWSLAESGGVAWEPVGSKRRTGPADAVTRFRRLVLRGKPDIIDFQRHGRRWVWLSLAQYLPCDEETIAKSLGFRWPDTHGRDWGDGRPLRTASERARLVLRAFTSLADWWGKNSKSPWGFTAGQLAWGILRTHLAPRTLCTHNDAGAHELERAACHGGRATCWYVGDVGDPAEHDSFLSPAPPRSRYGSIRGPLHLIDVRSMYPTLLRDHLFPVKLWSHRNGRSVRELETACGTYGAVVGCRVRVTRPEIPYRRGSVVAYPIGEYDTVLTAPEYRACGKSGGVVAVRDACLYDLAPAFRTAAGELIRMREEARKAGDFSTEFFAKLLANALGGKLAQNRGRWHERRRVAAVNPWGEWYVSRGAGKPPKRFRSIAGLVWEYVTDASGAGPHTAAFAHLTALGRLHMARIRESCPPHSVVSQDTDGLWVTDAGLAGIKAAGWTFGDSAGELRVVKTVAAARFYGPRHYWTTDGWVLAGFASPEIAMDGQWITDTRIDNPARRSAHGPPTEITSRTRRSCLKLDVPGMVVEESGWCHPRRVGQGN